MKISSLILLCFLFISCNIHNPPKEVQEDKSESEDTFSLDFEDLEDVFFRPTFVNKDDIFIPQNLEEVHKELDNGLSKHAKEILRKDYDELTSDEQGAYIFQLGHFGLGMWMRNNWNLWKGGKLSKYFNDLGIYHPDDMSAIIHNSYIAKLRIEDYDIKKDIEYYKDFWQSKEIPEEGSPIDGAEINWVVKIGDGKGTIHLGISKSDNSLWRYEYGSEKGIEPAKPNEIKDLKDFINRPFEISINKKVPKASTLKDSLVQSLKQKSLLDKVDFDWFGDEQLQTIEVQIGINVPLEISQSVLAIFSMEMELKPIVSLNEKDDGLWHTRRIYIGSFVKSGKKPIPPDKLHSLLGEQISHEDFVRIIRNLE